MSEGHGDGGEAEEGDEHGEGRRARGVREDEDHHLVSARARVRDKGLVRVRVGVRVFGSRYGKGVMGLRLRWG